MKKKILVKLPSDKEKIVLSFSFLSELHSLYKDEEIHLIIDEEKSEIIKFLSKKFLVHNLPKDKRSLMGIHHFVVNLTDVFNVDIFFDLDESLKSSFLGFNFRSKERYGFDNGINKIFLNKVVLSDKSADFDVKTFELLSKNTTLEYPIKKFSPDEYIKTVEDITKTSGDLNPDFLLCVMDAAKMEENFELFHLILNKIEDVRIRISFWGEDDSKLFIDPDVKKQMENWPAKKPIERIIYGEYGQFIKNLYQCKGLLTDIPWMGLVAGYYGVTSFVLRKDTNENFSPKLCQRFCANPINLAKNKDGIRVFENNESKQVSESGCLDMIHSRFNI